GDPRAPARGASPSPGGPDAPAVLDFSSFGAIEMARITLIEVDAHGRSRRVEVFAGDRLRAAVVRLYERYAELLPAGPARERAAATARSAAPLVGPFDPDRHATAYAL